MPRPIDFEGREQETQRHALYLFFAETAQNSRVNPLDADEPIETPMSIGEFSLWKLAWLPTRTAYN